jgi:hypothetical protein
MLGQASGPATLLADRRQADAATGLSAGEDLPAAEPRTSELPIGELLVFDFPLMAALLADDLQLEAAAIEIGEGPEWRISVGHRPTLSLDFAGRTGKSGGQG